MSERSVPRSDLLYARHVRNNPIKYNDPTGHAVECGLDLTGCDGSGGGGVEPQITPSAGGGYSGNSSNDSTEYMSFDGGWSNPEYEEWNILRQGSPCTACHVTHQTGTIPTNDEFDDGLVSYYRSMDGFSRVFHAYAFAFVAYTASETIAITETQTVYSRYMSRAELDAVQDTNTLRGGRPGDTYFSTNRYTTATDAQSALSLDSTPDVRVDFTITNNPSTVGPYPVEPDFGQPGGGIEYWSSDSIAVKIVEVIILLTK